MLRVNFYRPSYKSVGDKSAIKSQIGDKSAIKSENGNKIGDNFNESAINYKEKICDYLSSQTEARTQDIALFIGLKQSRTKDYLAELVEEKKIIANGANRNRTYSIRK